MSNWIRNTVRSLQKEYGVTVSYHQFIQHEETDFETAKTEIEEKVILLKGITLPYRFLQIFGISATGNSSIKSEIDPFQRNFLVESTFTPKNEDFIFCDEQKWYVSSYKNLSNNFLIITCSNTIQVR